jgi:hypothetical protein
VGHAPYAQDLGLPHKIGSPDIKVIEVKVARINVSYQ